MSSMTLKEFMTRGNGGMEKRGADFQFNVNGGSGPFVTWNNNKGYNTNLDQTELANHLIALYTGSGKEYWGEFDDYTKQRLLYELSSVLHDVVPKVLGGDKELLGRLDKSSALKTILSHLGVNSKPSEFITQSISEMTKDSNFRKFMLGAYKKNSGLVGSFADKYIIQSLMKKMGLDPSKVYEYAPGLAKYDMNQHIPGMALAFGLPFGIGALAGKPGLGLLLGLLGAGGYGYYKYNQMAGGVPDPADIENQFSTPPSNNYLSQPASTEKTEALSAPPEEHPEPAPESAPVPVQPAPPEAPAVDTESSTTETGPVSKAPGSEASTTTTQPASNPVQPDTSIDKAKEQEDLGLDALDTVNATPEQSQPSTPNTSQAKPVASPARPKNQFAAVKAPPPPQIVPDFSTPPKMSTQGLTPKQIAGADAFIAAYNQPKQDEITRQRNMQLYGGPTAPVGANTPIALGQKPIPVIKPVG